MNCSFMMWTEWLIEFQIEHQTNRFKYSNITFTWYMDNITTSHSSNTHTQCISQDSLKSRKRSNSSVHNVPQFVIVKRGGRLWREAKLGTFACISKVYVRIWMKQEQWQSIHKTNDHLIWMIDIPLMRKSTHSVQNEIETKIYFSLEE